MSIRKVIVPGFGALVLAASLAAAACGGGSSYSSTLPATAAPTASPAGVISPANAPTNTPAPAAAATVNAVANPTVNGTILVDSAGMTLYTFGNDTAGVSACTGGCATAWPPLSPGAGSPTAGAGVTGTLGTITRSDGSKQVTYNGMPLYGWQQDQKPGDVTGDGVNNFHVATP